MSKEISSILSFENISLSFNNKKILEDISFSLTQGQIITIIGPNGAGKSSILKLIIGLYKSSSGIIHKKKNLKIGYVPQKVIIDSLLPMTVKDFIGYYPEIFNYLELEDIKSSFLYTLSGGELQKVLLARALVRNPDLLLLDESSQGLDISGTLKFYNIIDKINKERKTSIIMVSHDLNVVLNRTDEVICLNRHICCKGMPDKITSADGFKNLYGEDDFNNIALYRHSHNHSHNRDGDII